MSNDNFPILIAEDDAVTRMLLKKTLIKEGHEVVSVENGQKAFDLLKENFFPIVLTDWMMPEMDGLELCRAIRQKENPGYVFIVLLTANDSQDDIISGLEAGADEYLTKPFNRAELFARLNTGRRFLEHLNTLQRHDFFDDGQRSHLIPPGRFRPGTALVTQVRGDLRQPLVLALGELFQRFVRRLRPGGRPLCLLPELFSIQNRKQLSPELTRHQVVEQLGRVGPQLQVLVQQAAAAIDDVTWRVA